MDERLTPDLLADAERLAAGLSNAEAALLVKQLQREIKERLDRFRGLLVAHPNSVARFDWTSIVYSLEQADIAISISEFDRVVAALRSVIVTQREM